MAPDARPFTTLEGSDIDSISTVNDGLQIHIPLWSIKQRGNLSLSFSLRYNSPSYSASQNCAIPNQPCSLIYSGTTQGVFVSASTDVTIGANPNIETNQSTGQQTTEGYYWLVTTPDSGTHKMVSVGNSLWRAADGTGWLFSELTYTLTSRDGVRYVYQGTPANTLVAPYPIVGDLLYVEDTNGNRITLNYTPYTVGGVTLYQLTSWTDTLGRTIPSSVYGGGPTPFGSFPTNTTDYTGCTGPNTVESAYIWTPPGASSSIKYCFATNELSTNFFNGAPGTKGSHPTEVELTGPVNVLQSVVLLDGSSFAFQYSPLSGGTYNYGELTEVTLPTGGTLSYTWDELFQGCPSEYTQAFPANYNRRSKVETRILNANDGTGAHTWTYGLSSPSSMVWGTTVQDPLGNTTQHDISLVSGNCGLYETETDYYDAANNLMRTDLIGYQGLADLGTFTQQSVSTGAALPISHTTKWSNGATRTTTTTYDSGFTGSGFAGSGTPATSTFPYGNVVKQTESDYGTTGGTAGAVLKTTQTSYWAFQNSTALAYNLLDKPVSVVITDGNNSTTQTTTYAYDGNSLSAGNASSNGWDASPPNGSVRGNLTSSSTYWDTSAANLTTIRTYTNTGLISSVTEPTNSSITPAASTSYQYSSTYDGGFVTKITDALSHTASSTDDLTTGHVLTSTDENTILTTYTYDSDLRLSGVSHPGNGHSLASTISYTYPDANTHIQTTQLNTSTPLETVTTRYDGMGRVTQVQHSDPEGDVYADTTYDGDGRKATQSTPYRAKSDATYGITSYGYDGLGREILVTNPDTTTSTTSYAGATTQNTNESNGSAQLQRLTRVDGLGRLISVCEVSSATPTVGSDTPTSCGLEISATGYLTTYTQTLRGMTRAVQGSQTRTFVYDSLGHITDSTNPELGHIHYVYDNDGNLITKTSPLANSTGSDTISINYTYDALHRMLSKSYTGTSGASAVVAAMPKATYAYDQTTVAGKTLENGVGRITSDYTTLSSAIQAESIYSYDPAGAMESHYQCVSSACSSSSYNDVEYHYDGAGNVISLASPKNSISATYNDAGHLTSVTPGWTVDSNHPSTLLTSALYAPSGGWSTATFGNGTSEKYSYTPRWLTGMQVTGANQTSAASKSTGSLTISGSEQSTQAATVAGVHASGTVTITGSEGTHQVCTSSGGKLVCNSVPDTGSLSITVNGFVATANYGPGASDPSVAATLSTALNATGSPVTASSSGAVITLASILVGPGGDYTLGVSNSSGPDFSEAVSGGALAGGTNPTTSTVYDSGTVTTTINGKQSSVSYSQSSTPASIAQALATAIASSSAGTLTATSSGASVFVSSVQANSTTNWPISASVSYNTTNFTSASFSVATSGMTGGGNATNANGTVYSYSLTHAADGQIVGSTDSVNGMWNYTYDEFNRLTAAANVKTGGQSPNSLTWDYDRYGNRWHQNLASGTGTTALVSFTAATNKATATLTYDIAGNVRTDGNHTYVYDAENRIASVDGSMSYIYDAEGRRVGKSNGTVYTVTASGDVLDEVDGTTWARSEVYLGGKHLATVTSSTVVFVHGDWLGSERARTNVTGVLCESQTSQPFGDNVQQSGTCNASPDFLTGKPRDTESNLDDFGARYLSSQWGRWMSADWTAGASAVPYATLTNPQSLNLYAYVGNDPVDGQDADGHARYDTGSAGCSKYASLCSDNGADAYPQQELDLEQLAVDAEVAALNAALQDRAGNGQNVAQSAATPASAPAQQQVSQAGVDFIKGWEGWNGTVDKKTGLTFAKDDGFGNGTIGWGHNCGACTDFAGGITKAQGDALLKSDLASYESSVSGITGGKASQQQFDALVSFAFNVKSYKGSTLMRNAASGSSVSEANFTAYGNASKHGVFVPVPSLMRRRESEWDVYANGVYNSSH